MFKIAKEIICDSRSYGDMKLIQKLGFWIILPFLFGKFIWHHKIKYKLNYNINKIKYISKHIKLVLKHKYYVGLELFRYNMIWRAILHDLSKISIAEIIGYSYWCFHPLGKSSKNKEFDNVDEFNHHCFYKMMFEESWYHHKKKNKHHWQYWIRTTMYEDGKLGDEILEMPKKYAIEMLCDWIGAGLAYTGKRDIKEWYEKEKNNIILHPVTKEFIESEIKKL